MNWSTEVWAEISPIYERILHMPFIKELKDGTLPLEKFQFYMAQDAHYLTHFSKALALIAIKTDDNNEQLTSLRFADSALVVEAALHHSYFEAYGIQELGVQEPACHHYTNFLISTASRCSLAVAKAAVLPCFWIYQQVGEYILKTQPAGDNPYQSWIDTYASEDFAASVEKAIQSCNISAATVTEQERQQMLQAFKQASELEFDFWEAAYLLRTWS